MEPWPELGCAQVIPLPDQRGSAPRADPQPGQFRCHAGGGVSSARAIATAFRPRRKPAMRRRGRPHLSNSGAGGVPFEDPWVSPADSNAGFLAGADPIAGQGDQRGRTKPPAHRCGLRRPCRHSLVLGNRVRDCDRDEHGARPRNPGHERQGGGGEGEDCERESSDRPVRRGADDSAGGVSPTHRGRARSARRSPVSRPSWSRSGPARSLR